VDDPGLDTRDEVERLSMDYMVKLLPREPEI
jgi:hypothetical protein